MIHVPLRTVSEPKPGQYRGLLRANPWTPEELQALRDLYAANECARDLNLQAFSDLVGRLKSNVCRKARELGLTHQKRPKIPGSERKDTGPRFATDADRKAHLSKSTKERLARDGHPRGALGMKHSAETRSRISEKSKARWNAMTDDERGDLVLKRIKGKRDKGAPIANVRGNWKAGWREIGGQRCFFRSRWEANYARYLEWLRQRGDLMSWEHEPRTFWFDGIKRGCVSYLPDFRVTENNGDAKWHEVKGWMDARSVTTLKRMAKYYPHEVVVLIREKQYREIEKKISSLIPEWERD